MINKIFFEPPMIVLDKNFRDILGTPVNWGQRTTGKFAGPLIGYHVRGRMKFELWAGRSMQEFYRKGTFSTYGFNSKGVVVVKLKNCVFFPEGTTKQEYEILSGNVLCTSIQDFIKKIKQRNELVQGLGD